MATLENTIMRDIYTIAFQVSPILFHNGIASKVPGGYLPVIALLGGLGLVQKAISGTGGVVGINDFSFQFRPMPGATILNQSVGMYPFANQTVAANATIQEPIAISLHMIAPVKLAGQYASKLPQMTALRWLMNKHNNEGGTYTILTPSYIYVDCLLLTMTDITSGETKQDQVAWQLDFIQPLISIASAAGAMSSLLSKATNGTKNLLPSWSGGTTGIGSAMPGAQFPGVGNIFGSLGNFGP